LLESSGMVLLSALRHNAQRGRKAGVLSLVYRLGNRDLTSTLVVVRVCDVCRKGDSQDPPEAPTLVDIQLCLQSPGKSPSFGTIQEDR